MKLTHLSSLVLGMVLLSSCQEVVVLDKVIEAAEQAKKEQELEERENRKQKTANGTVVFEDDQGHTRSEVEFRDGVKEGVARQFYPSGELWKESPYTDGELHGTARIYYESGKLKRTVDYRRGKKHGKFIKYFKSGKVKAEMEYQNDLIMPGTVEKDFKNNVRPLPKIVVASDNRLNTKGTYQVVMRLDQEAKNVQFYALRDKELWGTDIRLGSWEVPAYAGRDDQAYMNFFLEAGQYMDRQFHLFATFETSLGNEAVAYERLDVNIARK